MFRSKQSRLLCLLFALILCFQSFGLGVSASDSENLIDSNLTNWGNIDPDFTKVTQHYSNSGKPFYQITFNPQVINSTNTWLRFGQLYDLSNLTAGNSYTLKYHLFDYEDCVDAGLTISEEWLMNGILKYEGNLVIGVGSYSETIEWVDMIEGYYVLIDKDNYLDYFGKDNTFTFELPSISNPCIYIYYGDAFETGNTTGFYFSDFSLIDNDSAKEDGFLAKLFAWFQEKFDSIGESFANLGNKLTELKDGFINKITELKTSFENKITDLKESFQAKIDELKQGIVDLKDNLIEGIKSLFVPDEQAILDWKESLNTLLKNHLGIIYTCSELLTDTLNLAFDIIFDAPDTYKISIPEVSFEAAGTTVPVFSAQNIDFSFMEKPVFKTMYSMYTVAMYIFFGALEVKYALRVYRKVMNN